MGRPLKTEGGKGPGNSIVLGSIQVKQEIVRSLS